MTKFTAEILEYFSGKAELPTDLDPEDDIFASGLLDSLGVTDLVLFLEKCGHISIPLSELTVENFGSVNAISAYMAKKTDAR